MGDACPHYGGASVFGYGGDNCGGDSGSVDKEGTGREVTLSTIYGRERPWVSVC